MAALYDLKIDILRSINAKLGLSNRRSKDDNVNQIIHCLKTEYAYDGPYTVESIESTIAKGKPSPSTTSTSTDDTKPSTIEDTSVNINHDKLIADMIKNKIIKPSVLGKVNDPIPCIIETAYLKNIISLNNYINDNSESSDSDDDDDDDELQPLPEMMIAEMKAHENDDNDENEEEEMSDEDDDEDEIETEYFMEEEEMADDEDEE